MKKINALTPTQKAKLSKYRDKWLRIGLSTDPADRKRAEEGIVKAYMAAGLKPPRIIWCSSPLAVALTRTVVIQILKQRDSVGDSVWASVGDSVYGQHDAHWFGFYDFFNEVGLQDIVKKMDNLAQVAQSAGWWLPHQHICWVSERTCIVNQDDQHRLHCEDGPAVAYPDGFEIYAWHGTSVPQPWVMHKNSLTPQIALTHDNIEQRRAACEILGWDVILTELKATIIDTNDNPQIGELVEVDIPDIGREKFLRVTCGTGRRFAIPVPPDMTTALQANSWSYGLDETDYKPEIRT